MKKINLIAIFGKSASGKDTMLKEVYAQRSDKIHKVVGCTTRPPRAGEIDGVDYHFLTIPEFTKELLDNKLVEATCFNYWFYGTTFDEFDEDKVNIGIFNNEAIGILLEDDRLAIHPWQIICDDKERLIRALNREENPDCHEICRRFLAEEKDYETIDFEFTKIRSKEEFLGLFDLIYN